MPFPCSTAATGVLVVGVIVAAPVLAQTPTPGQTLERVTITGSNIPRTDQETVAPVEVITREQIERTGVQTVAEALVKLPYTGSGTFNETANTGAQGATSVSLRSLGQKATLVLLNGRRTAGYGFAQNVTDTFVDLSAIPVSAVDRVEILKDGASAIYGSDAIAGVVNIILRRDYRGSEAAASLGFFQGKNDYHATVIAGAGELGRDRFNVFGLVDYYKRDGLTMADTEFGRTRDQRSQPGGRNFQSLTGGGTWTGSGPANSVAANTRRAYAECPNVQSYSGAVALGLLPVNQSNLPLGSGVNQPGNTWCVRDFANVLSITPDNERIGFLGRGTYDFTPRMQGYAEVGASRNKTTFVFQEPFLQNGVRYYPVPPPAMFAYTPFNAIFAPGAAGNPLPFNATYAGVLNDLGPRGGDTTSDALRLLAGMKYGIGDWEFDSAVGYSKSEIDTEPRSQLAQGTLAAFGLPDARQPPTPTSTSSPYNLDRPSTNSPALRASMFTALPAEAKSDLKFVDTRATTDIGILPGGPVGLALGIEYRDESMEDLNNPLVQQGGVLNRATSSIDASRTTLAMYGEVAIPFTRQFEGQAALRYDHYSDFGTALSPKLGLKFKAVPELLLRSTWGRGFKAPTLPEVTPTLSFVPASLTDPKTGSASTVMVSISGNPDLSPEKSRTFTAGVVFEPNADFSVGLDFYQITWSGWVSFDNPQAIANNPNDPRVYRDPVSGAIVAIAMSYVNLTQVATQGVDIDVRYRANTTYGRLGTRLAANYVDSFEIDGTEYAGTDGAFIVSMISAVPRWKLQWSIDWTQGPWLAQLTMNYMHHYWRLWGMTTAPSLYRPGAANSIPQNGTLDPKSPSYTTFDLYARYDVTSRFSINGAVVNVTDQLPPFDPSFSTSYFYDRGTGLDVRGRTYRLGAQYKF